MQFARRKSKILLTCLLVCLPIKARAGFPVTDYVQIPPSVMENLLLVKEYGEKAMIYKKQFDQIMSLGDLAFGFDLNSEQLTLQKELKGTQGVYNLKVTEAFAPKTDACTIIALSPNKTSSVDSDKDDCVIKATVNKQSDKHIARGSGGYAVAPGTVTVGESKNSTTNNNHQLIEAERLLDIAKKLKEEHPYLFEKFETKEEQYKIIEENIEKIKPFDSSVITKPNSHLNYTEQEKKIASELVNNYLVPPFVGKSYITPELDKQQTVEQIKDASTNQAIHSIFTSNYARRIPGSDNLSEMVKMDLLSDYYYGGMNDGTKSLFSRINEETETMSESLLKREKLLIQALKVHTAIKEYKANLTKEELLARKILITLEE